MGGVFAMQKFPKCYEPVERSAARHVVRHVFAGRRGHGGGECTRRVLRPEELEVLLRVAIRRAGACIVHYERSPMRSKPEED